MFGYPQPECGNSVPESGRGYSLPNGHRNA
jgi:hypothetical protein